MQLNMMLTSLQNNAHVSHLLGFVGTSDVTQGASASATSSPTHAPASSSQQQLVEMLIKKLLCNISFEVVRLSYSIRCIRPPFGSEGPMSMLFSVNQSERVCCRKNC